MGWSARLGCGSLAPRPPLPGEKRDPCDPCSGDRVVDVAERVVEVLPAGAERPADPCEGKGPERGAEQREERVAAERRPEDPGGDRDERAHHGGDATEKDTPVLPAVEPALGAVELLRAEVQPASVSLEVGPPGPGADPPAADGADGVAERAGERHR